MPRGVQADPEEMKAFAHHLTKFAMDLRGLKTTTTMRRAHLAQSWRDQEHERFVEKYDQAIAPIDPLIQTLDDYSAFLRRKAGALEEFLRTRL
jgi:uncharacterized protein YukE